MQGVAVLLSAPFLRLIAAIPRRAIRSPGHRDVTDLAAAIQRRVGPDLLQAEVCYQALGQALAPRYSRRIAPMATKNGREGSRRRYRA